MTFNLLKIYPFATNEDPESDGQPQKTKNIP